MDGRIGAEQKRQSSIGNTPTHTASSQNGGVNGSLNPFYSDSGSLNPFYSDSDGNQSPISEPVEPATAHNHYATPKPKSTDTARITTAADVTAEEPNRSSQSWLYRNKRTGLLCTLCVFGCAFGRGHYGSLHRDRSCCILPYFRHVHVLVLFTKLNCKYIRIPCSAFIAIRTISGCEGNSRKIRV